MASFAPGKTKSSIVGKSRAAPATVGAPVKRAPIRAALTSLGIMAKLKVSHRGDPAEQEADQVAERVVAMSDAMGADAPPGPPAPPDKPGNRYLPAAQIHRSECSHCDEEPDTMVHTAPIKNAFGVAAPLEDLAPRVAALQHCGLPMPEALRAYMEPRFGQDFSSVRLHTDSESASLSGALQAHAFTVGEHIAFGPGEFRPDSAAGRKLIAHELTHVVQQRGTGPMSLAHPSPAQPEPSAVQRREQDTVRRSDDDPGILDSIGNALSDTASSVGDSVASVAWGVVRRLAPRLEPILREGPFNWMKRQLGDAFHGIVDQVTSLLPAGAVQTLNTVFGGLVDRAARIVAALASGDCGPLFQAMDDIKTFVTEVAGEAWDKLVDFLRPVGDFFSHLWSSYGAPAVQWLREFAGDVWQVFSDLGHDLWAFIEPVRRDYATAWNWLKTQIFGPEDESASDSSGGIVGWISDKAGEAWSWVKEQTRPVWQPVSDALDTVRSLIPPPFIRRLGESFQQLGAQLNQARSNLGDDGDDVAQNREALASVLPSVQQVLAAAREGIVSAKAWVLDTVGGLATRFTGVLSELRNSSILSPVAGALAWLEGVGNDLNSWAQQKVAGLFDFVLRAFDYIAPFVETMLGLVRQVISVMADILQLPLLILGRLWNLIPACIRNPIRDFFINQILSRIPVFSFLLEIPDLWAQVEAVALRILRQVFVDGNLAGAAWTFFRNMLRLVGIPPELVVSILAKAASAIGDILTNPVRFLTTLLSGVVNGFGQFFGNIGTHLLNGITGWLFGAMEGAGITPPREFSLRSILGIVLQILDITVDRIFERLGRRVGPEVVARLRQAVAVATGVWEWVAVLIEEGPGGLWRMAQERLSSLWSTVLDTAIGWITERVIAAGIRWLAGFLDITGIMPVINTLVSIYRAIQSVAAYIRQILEVINTGLDGIGAMARGDPGPAANFVELGLSRIVPIAIGFVANQVGLGDISHRIREVIEGVRALVDQAIDWLIDRALAMGRAFLDLLRRGVSAVRGGVAALREWWRRRQSFHAEDGEDHSLYFTGSGASARLMIASNNPQPYQSFIQSVEITNPTPAKLAAKTDALRIAGELDAAVHAAASAPSPTAAPTASVAPGSGTATGPDPATQINLLLSQLATATAIFMPSGGTSGPSTPPQFGSTVNGFGASVRVERLGPNHEYGSHPGDFDSPGGVWGKLNRRRSASGRGSYYIKGHLLNEQLGGPGTTWQNLTPLSRSGNSAHFHGFEGTVKEAVHGAGGNYNRNSAVHRHNTKVVNFVVSANYGGQPNRSSRVTQLRDATRPENQTPAQRQRNAVLADVMAAETSVPSSLDCTAVTVEPTTEAGRVVANARIENSVDTDESSYNVNV